MASKQAITIFDKCYELIRRTQEGQWTQSWTAGRFPKEMSVKLSAEVSWVGVYLAKKEIKTSTQKTSKFYQTVIHRKKRQRRVYLLTAKHCESALYVLNNCSAQQYGEEGVINLIVLRKKQRLRDFKQVAPSHGTREWHSLDSNPGTG